MEQLKQCPDLEALAALVDGQLEKGIRLHIIDHLGECSRCRAIFSESIRLLYSDKSAPSDDPFQAEEPPSRLKKPRL